MLRPCRITSQMSKSLDFDLTCISKEIDMLQRDSNEINWSPKNNLNFKLIIPPTVYPPREDTDLMANRIISLGSGSGKKMLEIGCGSGALSILGSYLGWDVQCCDVNPYAAIATRGNLAMNSLSAEVKEGGLGPEKFPFENIYDLIIWNLPYIQPDEVDKLLGPMEEASSIDNDTVGLGERTLTYVTKANLLKPSGRVLLLSKKSKFNNSNLSSRVWDELEFKDGEKIFLTCHWKPFNSAPKLHLDKTKSTNDDLLNHDTVGSHVYTSQQTCGRGRRSRVWKSFNGSYAGSWVVHNGPDIKPGLLSLAGGLAVFNAIGSSRISIKWPNDLYIGDRKLCGILVEGTSIGTKTKAILGVGINLRTDPTQDERFASLDEIKTFEIEEFDRRLNLELSSLIEKGEKLPPVNINEIISSMQEKIIMFGKPQYDGKIYDKFRLNENGELLLGKYVLNDGDDVLWVQSSRSASTGSRF